MSLDKPSGAVSRTVQNKMFPMFEFLFNIITHTITETHWW